MLRATVRFKTPMASRPGRAVILTGLLVTSSLVLAACSDVTRTLTPRETFTQGYVVDEETLALVPVGSSRDQVLLALGTPSTTGTLNDGEAFYYISQTRTRAAAFMKPKLVSRRVLAIYFDGENRVASLADYGLQDGRVFDAISRTTPTGGSDSSFIVGIIRGVAGGGTGAASSTAGTIFGN